MDLDEKICAIITAGGTSSRFGNTNKLMEKVNGKEVIRWTCEAFLKVAQIDDIVITANLGIMLDLGEMFKSENRIRIVQGGDSRQQSVMNGLLAIQGCSYVLIHDGARPMISKEIIEKSIQAVKEKGALTVAAKTIDTIKQVDNDLKIIKTVDRSNLFNTQTPQVFEYKKIFDAHVELKGQNFTDDAGMLESLGEDVYVLEGEYKNIKITTQSDLEIAKGYLL